MIAGDDAARDPLDRELAAWTRRLSDASFDPAIVIDDRGRVVEFNPAAERCFGHGRAAALGRPLIELIIPARLRDRGDPAFARLTAAGQPSVIERIAMRADGSELPVRLSLLVTERSGRRYVFAFVRDLTTERQVEESVALRTHALEQAQVGIVISDPVERTITNVNLAYAHMLGYEPGELIGYGGERLIAPASQRAIAEAARVLHDRGHHVYDLQLVRKDGSTVPVVASSSMFQLPSGARMRVSTVLDVTERDELERARAASRDALARSAARLEIVSGTGHEFATACADIGRLLDLVARRLGEIIGDGCAVQLISDDGVWLEPSACCFHRDPAGRERAHELFARERQRVGEGLAGRVAATGEPALIPSVEPAALDADGPPSLHAALARLGVTSALALPLRSRDRTLGTVSLVRTGPGNPYTVDDQRLAQDLADRAGLAIDNAVLVATLEQRVAERTAALEASNHELEAFSYSVSHDLRTPLRAIDGFSRALLADYADVLDDRACHYLTRVRSGTQRMAELIDDLLALARISRTRLRRERLDLSQLAADVAAELHRREPARAVAVHIAPGLSAHADARLVRIALENLLGNAWKFTARREGAEIWFDSDRAAFYVRDNGAGFDMAVASKLFTPFQRFHAAKEYDGTGIGLATVHRIVTHHGGRIWAEAKIGRGAAFFFTLGDHRG